MKKAAALALRTILAIEGILLILRSHQVIATLVQRSESYGQPMLQYWVNLGTRLEDGAPVFGMCALITAWGLLSGRRWADRASLILSIFHLILFPFFTPAGFLGLAVWRRRSRVEDGLNARWREPLPSSVLPGAFRMLATVAIGCGTVMLYMLIGHGIEHRGELLPAWTIPVLLAIGFGVLTVLHDLGHVFAGKVSGFHFDTVAVGGLEFVRKDSGSGWSLRRKDQSVWRYLRVGAQVTRLDRLDSRLVVLQLGGPLCEFVVGLITFACALAVPNPYAREICGLVSVLAFGRYVMEMALLYTPNDDYTDGARLVQLWRRDPEGERWCALHAIARSQAEPVSPRQWTESWVIRVSADPESPVYAAGCFYAYAYYMDCNDIEKAEEYIDRLRSIKGWNQNERVAVEVAFFEAYTNQRSAAAGSMQPSEFPQTAAAMRMQAMALVSDGHTSEAAEKIEASRSALAPRGGWTIFENRLLGEIERRIQESRAAAESEKEQQQAPPAAPDPRSFAELIRRTAM